MSIKAESRYFANAHRVSDIKLSDDVTTLNAGQWLSLDSEGEWVISDGTEKSYLTISSKNSDKDNVDGVPDDLNGALSGKVVALIGPYRLETDQYDDQETYTVNSALVVDGNGVVTLYDDVTDDVDDIVAYVWKVPSGSGDYLGIIHE